MLQAPAHDNVRHIFFVLLGNLQDDWMLPGWICTTDDCLATGPGHSQRAVRGDVDVVVIAIRNELVVAPDWMHLHLSMAQTVPKVSLCESISRVVSGNQQHATHGHVLRALLSS